LYWRLEESACKPIHLRNFLYWRIDILGHKPIQSPSRNSSRNSSRSPFRSPFRSPSRSSFRNTSRCRDEITQTNSEFCIVIENIEVSCILFLKVLHLCRINRFCSIFILDLSIASKLIRNLLLLNTCEG